jgi:hypothetical protein
MGKKVDKIQDLMYQLDRVGRNGITGYEIDKIYVIVNESIKIISSLKKLDDNLKLEVLKDLNYVLALISKRENDVMDLIRQSTSPIISVLNFYGIEFY